MQHIQIVFRVFLCSALIGCSAACSYQQKQPAPDTRAADERAIRAAAAEWAKVAAAKDLEKTLSFYAEDASMFPPNAPIATGKDQRRQVWSQFMALPGYGLKLETTRVEASKS